jgi:hypothetical protein
MAMDNVHEAVSAWLSVVFEFNQNKSFFHWQRVVNYVTAELRTNSWPQASPKTGIVDAIQSAHVGLVTDPECQTIPFAR